MTHSHRIEITHMETLEKRPHNAYNVPMLKRRPSNPPNAEKFWSLADKSKPPCWQWTGPSSPLGYGYFGRYGVAHRVAYEIAVGPIPDGLEIDHLCRNRGCVNPEHLDAVTHRQNILRGETLASINAAKTHCWRGHPFDEGNTRVSAIGYRTCRACNQINVGKWADRNRDKVRAACLERVRRLAARRASAAKGLPAPEWAAKRCEPWGKPKAAYRSREERRAMWAARVAKKTDPA